MTPEERLAEKLRRQKLVEESDFELAKETFGKFALRMKVICLLPCTLN